MMARRRRTRASGHEHGHVQERALEVARQLVAELALVAGRDLALEQAEGAPGQCRRLRGQRRRHTGQEGQECQRASTRPDGTLGGSGTVDPLSLGGRSRGRTVGLAPPLLRSTAPNASV
jgi:hypothetical protein